MKELIKVEEQTLVEYLNIAGVAQNLTDNETKQFVQIAQMYCLNPFKREIYAIKYGKGGKMSIVTGYETYLKRAERTGMMNGWEVTHEGKVANNTLKAIITIHRKDYDHPFKHEVYYSEYVQLKSDGRPNQMWATKPLTMIKKVAMAQGFRLAFPDELGGMPHTTDEYDTAPQTVDVVEPVQVVEETKEEPKADEGLEVLMNKLDEVSDNKEAFIKLWDEIKKSGLDDNEQLQAKAKEISSKFKQQS